MNDVLRSSRKGRNLESQRHSTVILQATFALLGERSAPTEVELSWAGEA